MTSRSTAVRRTAVVRELRAVEALPRSEEPVPTVLQRAPADPKRSKPGRKPARPYTMAELGQAFLGLRRELETAAQVAKTGVVPRTSAALEAAVLAYAKETDPHGWVRSSLAYAAARLALGHAFADVVKPGLLPVEVRLTPKLVAAIERKQHESPLGKALAVYRIIAKGHDEVPTRREPTGELKRLLEWRLSQFTD